MRVLILAALALVGCDRYLCDDVEAAARGGEIVREIYGWDGRVDVICKPLARANDTCRTDSPTLEGCAPFPGRAIVVEGRDVCRVVVHEGAHWLDPTCGHEDACWPTDAETNGKNRCTLDPQEP
jgi:hypothetical protein